MKKIGNLKTLIESSKKTLLGTSSTFDKFIKENEVDLKVCKKFQKLMDILFFFLMTFLNF